MARPASGMEDGTTKRYVQSMGGSFPCGAVGLKPAVTSWVVKPSLSPPLCTAPHPTPPSPPPGQASAWLYLVIT